MANLLIKELKNREYHQCWQEMSAFTNNRSSETTDEIWLLQHPKVFTLGQAGDPKHVLNLGTIPLVHTDRGGQVTYHGPGQLICYVLFDLRRLGIGPKTLVRGLENVTITLLRHFNIIGMTRPNAPGVYVDGAKIAALGLRIRRGCSFHGLAINIDNDLTPFQQINPCGFKNMPVTSILNLLGKRPDFSEVERILISEIAKEFGYTNALLSSKMECIS